jgi:hypothetical protein
MAPRHKPAPAPHRHPFLESRFVGACSLLALGVAVGFSLMLAKILVLFGLIIVVGSAFAAFSIYAKHYRSVYSAVKNGKRYQSGPGAIELLVSLAAIMLVVAISPVLYFANASEEIQLHKAEVRLVDIEASRSPGLNGKVFVNVRLKNSGSLTASNVRLIVSGMLVNGPALKDTKPLLTKVENELTNLKEANSTDVLTQDFMIVTIPDLILLDEEWNAVLQGTSSLYVFYSLSYQDDAIRAKGHWHGDFCAYFTYRQNFYHNCGPNHLERVAGAQ